mgnify:CR=1 FL=1
MKKNILKLSVMVFGVMLMAAAIVASASSYTNIVSITTPSWGGVSQNHTTYNSKSDDTSKGTIYTTYQATALQHSISLTYINYTGNTWVQGSDWVAAQVDSIKRPELWLTTTGTTFFSQAKSNNLEPTNNTVVKFRFSADTM